MKKQLNILSIIISTPTWIIFYIYNWKLALIIMFVIWGNNLMLEAKKYDR